MELENWLINNRLKYNSIFKNKIFNINEEYFIVIEPKENLLFDEDFDIILDDNERSLIEKFKVNNYLFEFGGKWYYSNISKEKIELNLFKYIGNADLKEVYDFPYLGIHGKYDLCNGSRDYKDWIKKAKFLGITTLGICETNTLAGTLAFQEACKEEKIDFIIGEEVLVKDKKNNDEFFIKLYVKNQNGWENLLLINTEINVHNSEEQYISIERLFELSEDLICIITFENNSLIKKFKKHFTDIYYQFDTVEYLSDEKDKEHLLNLKKYLELKIDIQPVFIFDSYYLDKEDGHIRYILNKIGKTKFHNQSHDQYFKSLDDILIQMIPLFREDDSSFDDIINKGLENLTQIKEECKFEIDTKTLHLPEYEMTNEEKKKFKTNEDLFWHLIEEGLVEKKLADEDIYIDRVQEEVRVIKKGNIINYFLILWDIINWCNKNDILTGVGRGSSAGSLISYLLNITNLDPLKYDLLFERFLNEARLLGELPDVDSDFEGKRRDDVKKYMEQKYGIKYFASIGTYTNLKLKALIKDLSREKGIEHSYVNYITQMIDDESKAGNLTSLFECASKSLKLKEFIKKYPDIINNIELCLYQPKSSSIHASATVITPKFKEINLYKQIPIKKMSEQIVTEWEGKMIEKAGFLKEDILSTAQLDKFSKIIKFIKENRSIDIDYKQIPTNDNNVFDLFKKGLTEDVFQFGTDGLKSYCKYLQPNDLEELIAANALFRPGAMDSKAHIDYVKIKFGEKYPEYDFLLKDITKKTFGLYIYQEQIMIAFQKITESSLQEADIFRKIITKLKSGIQNDENFNKYKNMFIDNYIKKGSDKFNAEKVWNKLVAFARYGFNRSHAACYAFEAYCCQWFKYHYPLEFWTTSLIFSLDKDKPSRVFEIEELKSINISPPDINSSNTNFTYSVEKNTIYWSLTSIKFVGDKIISYIIDERNTNGNFYSFDEFIQRVKKVNKRVIINMIICGVFDDIENIKDPKKRIKLILKYCNNILPDILDINLINKEFYWILKQKELCGLGNINYTKIANNNNIDNFCNYYDFIDQDENSIISFAGILNKIIFRNTKKGKMAQLELDNNNSQIFITIWPEFLQENIENIENKLNNLIFFKDIIVKYDSYKNMKVLQTDKKTKIVTI